LVGQRLEAKGSSDTPRIEAGIEQKEMPLDRFRSKIAVGDEAYLTGLGERCRRATSSVEIPRAQRFAGRPTLSDLFRGVVVEG
jgi:hypothetical protein